MEVSVRELKNHLSEYLRRTQLGEEIMITSRGRPVGRLVSPVSGSRLSEDEAVARLRKLPGLRFGNGKKLLGADQATPVPSGTTREVIDWVRGE